MIHRVKAALLGILPKNSFVRKVSVIVSGTAGAQAMLILAAPLLTRLFTPEDFGLLAVYASLLALISVVSSLRYELAIPLPVDDQEAADLTVLCLILLVIISLLCSVIVFYFGNPIALALGVENLAIYFWLLPVGVFLSGAYSVFSYWGVRESRFSTIAKTKISQALVTLSIQLAGYKIGGLALILGQVAGHSVGTSGLAIVALKTDYFKNVGYKGVVNVFLKYKRFPIFSTLDGLSNKAGVQLPPLLFASLFSPAGAGLYIMADRVLQLPISIIGTAIGQVFLSEAAEAERKGEIGVLVSRIHEKLAHLGMAPALMILLIGPDLFEWVFGSGWRLAGQFAQWMTIWLYFVFVTSPITSIFAVMGRQFESLLFQVGLLAARIFVIYLGAKDGDLLYTIMLFSCVSAAFWMAQLLWISHLSQKGTLNKIFKQSFYALLFGLPCVSPIILGDLMQTPDSYVLVWSLPFSLVLIALNYWRMLRKAY